MTVISVTTANIGTKLATAADTKITGLTVTQPSATADLSTPLTLVDAAAAPAAPVGFFRTLYSAALPVLTFLFGVKPTGPSMAPGLTAPTWPQAIVTGSISFTAGVFVASCPAGVTFSLTTAP
jgi:hypothetical protein